MKTIILKLLPVCLFFICCNSRSQSKVPVHKEGRIRNALRFYDEKRDTALCLYIDIWYLDSTVVQKITGHHSHTANGVTRVTYPLLHYSFMDLHTMRGKDYCEFTDSAKAYREYPLTDTLWKGGWPFYANRNPKIGGPLQWLPDTVMEGISYRRAWFTYLYPKNYVRKMMGFFRCDLQDTLFMLHREVSRMAGCPMVMLLDYGKNLPDFYAKESVEFITDTLTPEERRVLAAWRRE